ncbi:CopD family protein [Pseudohalioglobus lutimaris]|uniref:Protoporphyrinogen IX oxidase n=1 Tax=Pseudohalioglobus lutimaris TaxID=1737061 RepID=A0A2N5X176_9GAMM|nr:CopD family protein [Pseudohalioglobus lutimaris]PLW68243.1 CopD family protein [Pseudohalioglobus lutimaris]
MLWMKALHIIFVVCWFAGLFYLPRLFVNYAASDHPQTRETLAIMARRLYRFITPFMYILMALGIGLFSLNPDYYMQAKWFWLKMAGMVFLVVYHLQCGRYVKAIMEKSDDHSHTFYRFFNEVPVLFLFAMVILAVLKPF